MNTFEKTESLLKVALLLSQNTVKQIGKECAIKPNTLYKWRTTDVRLSPAKVDAILLYFIEKEPGTLMTALALNYVLTKLFIYLTSLTEEEVPQEE